MLTLNGTVCVYAGGDNHNGSDYNQLLIRRPTPDYALDKSNDCKNAVKVGYKNFTFEFWQLTRV